MEMLPMSAGEVGEAGIATVVEQLEDLGNLGTAVVPHEALWDPASELNVGRRLLDQQLLGQLVCPLHL